MTSTPTVPDADAKLIRELINQSKRANGKPLLDVRKALLTAQENGLLTCKTSVLRMTQALKVLKDE